MRLRSFIVVALAAGFALALEAPGARAVVVGNEPTWPIPADAANGPPPIPALAPATDPPPPPEEIGDPVTPGATCGGWYLQSNYGDRWPTGSSNWWEYRCTHQEAQYYPHPCIPGSMCEQVCYGYPFDCYWVFEDRTDLFSEDGGRAAFLGQFYSYSVADDNGVQVLSNAWWDAPTAQWYLLGPYSLVVRTAGTGSGNVSSTPSGIACAGDFVLGCDASFDAGTVVTLSATAHADSSFTGWSGDCSGTGTCQVTIDRARSVTATFARQQFNQFNLTVAKAGTGSGHVSSSPPGIACGLSCQASFDAGTIVSLSATPDAGSNFTGWSGDCSGTGSCQVTVDQARSVTATFVPNAPPYASFTITCSGLACSVDGSGSADSDGSIISYSWDFGDGSGGSGRLAEHTYAQPRSYTVTLTVTDSAGSTATSLKAFNPISVSARGYKVSGLQKVDLSWSGPSGTSFDIYRDGGKIATVQAGAYTDNVNKKGAGSYVYKVCEVATSVCSNEAAVSF